MMKSRRIVLQTLAVGPLATSVAFAQTGEQILPEIAGKLEDKQRVRQAFQDTYYYVELLRRKVPDKVPDAELTLQNTSRAYEANYAKADWKNSSSFLANAAKAYDSHQREFEGFLGSVGIAAGSPAASIINESVATVLLIYIVVNKVQDVFSMRFCIFPFCFGRPG